MAKSMGKCNLNLFRLNPLHYQTVLPIRELDAEQDVPRVAIKVAGNVHDHLVDWLAFCRLRTIADALRIAVFLVVGQDWTI